MSRWIVVLALALAGCDRPGPLLTEVFAAVDAVPMVQSPGDAHRYGAERAKAEAEVAGRWFPEGLPAREAEKILVAQQFEIIRSLPDAPPGVSAQKSRCGVLSCEGAAVDVLYADGKVSRAAITRTWSNIFSF